MYINVEITSVVTGVLKTTPRKLKKRLEKIGFDTKTVESQKIAIIYYSNIIRRIIEL